MIHKVLKKTIRKGQVSKVYWLRYRYADMPAAKWKSLGVTNKEAAESKASVFRKEWEQEQAGIIAPRRVREAASKDLSDHLAAYEADMQVRGTDDKYRRLSMRSLARLARELDWKILRDINAPTFESWRHRNRYLAPKTLNDYLVTLSTFLSWAVQRQFLPENPLRFVKRVDGRTRGQARRAFSETELARLLEVASEPHQRAILAAVYTGLRRNELTTLRWSDIHLDAPNPYLQVKPANAKNRKKEPIPLWGTLLEMLKAMAGKGILNETVFTLPANQMMRSYCQKAGIPVKDGEGRKVDFHALRKTFGTHLASSGVPLQLAQHLMRHSDPRLTAGIYTDPKLLPMHDAVKSLSEIPGTAKVHIRVHETGKPGRGVAQSVATGIRRGKRGTPEMAGVGVGKSRAVASNGMVRAAGFEPAMGKQALHSLARLCNILIFNTCRSVNPCATGKIRVRFRVQEPLRTVGSNPRFTLWPAFSNARILPCGGRSFTSLIPPQGS